MDPTEYQRRAMRTQAKQGDILLRLYAKLGVRGMQLLNGLTGLTDEVGEIASAVKKYVEYGQPLDTVNLQEEVGDALWRLAQICDAAGLTLGGCMASNLEKLKIRFPERYSDERAAESGRDRGAERSAVEKRPDPYKDKHYQTPPDRCEYCRGTGYHQYKDFEDGTPNFSDSAACGACKGSGNAVEPIVQDGHGFGHADEGADCNARVKALRRKQDKGTITKAEVRELQTDHAFFGCCNRFADMQGCDCMENAK